MEPTHNSTQSTSAYMQAHKRTQNPYLLLLQRETVVRLAHIAFPQTTPFNYQKKPPIQEETKMSTQIFSPFFSIFYVNNARK